MTTPTQLLQEVQTKLATELDFVLASGLGEPHNLQMLDGTSKAYLALVSRAANTEQDGLGSSNLLFYLEINLKFFWSLNDANYELVETYWLNGLVALLTTYANVNSRVLSGNDNYFHINRLQNNLTSVNSNSRVTTETVSNNKFRVLTVPIRIDTRIIL